MTQLLLKLVVAVTLTAAHTAGDDAKPRTHMTDAGHAALVLSQITGKITTSLDTFNDGHARISQHLAHAIAAAAQTGQPETAKAAWPVALTLAKKMTRTATLGLSFAPTALKATALAANISGHQFATAAFTGATISDFTTGAADPSTAAGGDANIARTAGPAVLTNSKMEKFNQALTHSNKWTEPNNFDGITLYTAAIKAKVAGNDAGPLVSKGDATTSHCKKGAIKGGQTVTASHICVVGGAVTEDETLKITKDNNDFGTAGGRVFSVESFEHYAQNAAKAVHASLSQQPEAANSFDPTNLNSYLDDDDFKTAVGELFGNLDRKTSLTADNSQMKSIIKNIYGNGAEIQSKFWDKLKTINKPAKILGEDATGDITTVSDLGTALKLLLETKVKESKSKQQAAAPVTATTGSEKETETKKENECKKHTTSEACKKEKGCDFDEKKPEGERCFPKVDNDKKDEKSFSRNLRVSVSQVFAAFAALLF
uniref:Variant surface glycoprotein 606 n=1 Tax=Trypanosoma brucei TaxID=5691 RepID=M4SYH7_9TRYP|nr:variant surface glycoprotein 606 [Trypanosoma brucei]